MSKISLSKFSDDTIIEILQTITPVLNDLKIDFLLLVHLHEIFN